MIELVSIISTVILWLLLSIVSYFIVLFAKESYNNFNDAFSLTFFFIWIFLGFMIDWISNIPSFVIFLGMITELIVFFRVGLLKKKI